MKFKRDGLLADLEMVRSGLSPREFIEQSSCFVFQDGWVMTFNDEVACRKKLPFPSDGAVQATSLLDILGKVTDEELDVSVGEGEKGELLFEGKRKRFGVVLDRQIFLPIDRVEMPKKWEPLDPAFTEAVAMIKHCVSVDQSRFLLTCIHIQPNYIEACDNHQVMRCKVETPCITESVLVRGTSLEPLSSLAMDSVSLTKSWIHFKNQSGLIYSCRRYAEEYPALSDIFKLEGHPIVLPKTLVDAADRAAVFSSDKTGDSLVSVVLREGTLTLKGEGLSGWYEESKKVAYDGPALTFLIAPELLKHICTKYDEAIIGPGKLKASGGAWRYVTVLGRPDAPAESEGKKRKKQEPDEPAE